MSHQNLFANFASIKTLFNKTQLEIYEVRAILNRAKDNNYDLNETPAEFLESSNSKITGLYKKINKALMLLSINSQILNGALNSSSAHFDKLEYLMQYDKYQERFTDLKKAVADLQLLLDSTYIKIVEVNRGKLLQNYEAPEEQKLNAADTQLSLIQDKDNLFASRSKEIEKLSTNEKVLKTNMSITSGLATAYSIMVSNVVESELNIEKFDQSTNDLIRISDGYGALSNMLLSSKQFVNELQKADSSDLRRMKLALGWFALCCFWILWRRILKYPVYLLFWLVWTSVKASFYIVGLVKSSSSSSLVALSSDILITASASSSVTPLLSIVQESIMTSSASFSPEDISSQDSEIIVSASETSSVSENIMRLPAHIDL